MPGILLSQRLKALRLRKKLSQTGLSCLTGINSYLISRWENRYSFPDLRNLCRLADALDVTLDYLVGRPAKSLKASQELDAEKDKDVEASQGVPQQQQDPQTVNTPTEPVQAKEPLSPPRIPRSEEPPREATPVSWSPVRK